jgi:hypothetical protein
MFFTGKVVNVVDTNGSEYGLHSYHNGLHNSKSKRYSSEFKTIKKRIHLNTSGFVSPIVF